jgi:hypothetical protein
MEFKKLDVTTHTIMVYANCTFDMQTLKEKLHIEIVSDLKDTSNKIHGHLYAEANSNAIKFRNQIPLRIFIINKMIAVKVFKTGKLHFTGCKTMEQAYKATAELFKQFRALNSVLEETILSETSEASDADSLNLHLEKESTKSILSNVVSETSIVSEETNGTNIASDTRVASIVSEASSTSVASIASEANSVSEKTKKIYNGELTITFETVMVNIGFELDFIINREKLDNLIQQSNINNMYSVYEPITQTSVNIKMRYLDPENKLFNQMILAENNSYILQKVSECPKSKKRDEREHTFLVFGGSNKNKIKHKSKVIQSGRYYDTHMELAFNSFLEFVQKNRDKIEMKKEESSFDIRELIGI